MSLVSVCTFSKTSGTKRSKSNKIVLHIHFHFVYISTTQRSFTSRFIMQISFIVSVNLNDNLLYIFILLFPFKYGVRCAIILNVLKN
jgi:hypothetical protein